MALPPLRTVYPLFSKSDSKSDSNESQCESVDFIERTHLKSKKTTIGSTQLHYHHYQQSVHYFPKSDSKSDLNESQGESVYFIEKKIT